MTDTQVQELLKPRYKVMADYPHSDYKVGDIISFVREVAQSYDECKLSNGETMVFKPSIAWLNKWPNLFKRLEWWEERKLEEMPKYVKMAIPDQWNKGAVIKVDEWGWHSGDAYIIHYKKGGGTLTNLLLPATEEEYLSFINQTNSK